MFETIAGAVNGVPCTRAVQKDGANVVTLDDADDGVADTIDVNTDGSGSVAATGGRVAIIGGTTPGRDHFPWPAQDGIDWDGTPVPPSNMTGAKTSHPIGLTLAQAMKWLLRVKTWTISIPAFHDGRDSADYGPFTFTTDDQYIGPDSSVDYRPITREGDLVGPQRFATGGIEDWAVDERQQWGSDFYLGLVDENQSGLYFQSPLFHSSIMLRIRGWTGDPTETAPGDLEDHGHLIFITDPANTGTPADWSLASVNVAIDGVSVPLYKSHMDTTITSDVIVAPTAYWPYATRGGLPVYDTTTGAVLNDPLS